MSLRKEREELTVFIILDLSSKLRKWKEDFVQLLNADTYDHVFGHFRATRNTYLMHYRMICIL